MFVAGGYTLYKHYDQLLREKFQKSLEEFKSILDWGAGCGRLSRYLLRTRDLGDELICADIDEDNVRWCSENLPGAMSAILPLMPPSSLESEKFDLVIGYSVMTHLSEAAQFAWLDELNRTMAAGGVALLTVHSVMDLMRASADPAILQHLLNVGLVDSFHDHILDDFVSDPEYYRATFHTHEYIRSRWSKWFTVKDIVTDVSGQEVVVLVKD